MTTKFDKFNTYANISASICGAAGVLYILSFGGFFSGAPDPVHVFSVWAMIVSYNVAIVFRTMFRMGRPKKSESAWATIKAANVLAGIFLALELGIFFSTGMHDFVTFQDGRVFALFPLYLVQQIMRTIARSKL